jgi:UDP-N-acetylmuramoylalanine--D-glutamate ligase
MNVAIIGYGAQGHAAYEYWKKLGDGITVCDQNEIFDIPHDVNVRIGANYLKDLEDFDLIVRSPSVHPRDLVNSNTEAILDKVTTVTDEFLRVCPSRNVIGVTGTKGKGTTSTLIAKMLEADGKLVHLGGNIGTPPLDLLKENIQPNDYVVLELANFQLIDIKHSPHIAVCLMVAPEHLDWHPTVEEYYEAKAQLFRYQDSNDVAIYYAENRDSKTIASKGQGKKIPYMEVPGAIVENGNFVINRTVVCSTSELKLLGKHNWQNVCAAITAFWQVSQNEQAAKSVLTYFSGLEHRLELIRSLEGISFYDDSFGTTPETAIVALEAFTQPKVIILGGSDKGASYDNLAQVVVDNNVRSVVLIGDQAKRIKAALQLANYTSTIDGGDSMTEIVNVSRKTAKTGDVVLLSTGCASFDMFKNYIDRGEQFSSAVQALV